MPTGETGVTSRKVSTRRSSLNIKNALELKNGSEEKIRKKRDKLVKAVEEKVKKKEKPAKHEERQIKKAEKLIKANGKLLKSTGKKEKAKEKTKEKNIKIQRKNSKAKEKDIKIQRKNSKAKEKEKKAKAMKIEKSHKPLNSKRPKKKGPSLKFQVLENAPVITKKTVPKPMKLSIGFIGHGKTGSAIVQNLLKTKRKVIMWNKNCDNIEKSVSDKIEKVDTLSELISNSNVIIWYVSSMEESKNLFYDHLAFRNRLSGKSLIDLTYSNPESALYMHDTVSSEGGYYLEGRVQGNLEAMKNGKLKIFVSGHPKAYNMGTECLKAISKRTYYCGAIPGKASRLSVLSGNIIGLSMCASSECLEFLENSRLPLFPYYEMISVWKNGPLRKYATQSVSSLLEYSEGHFVFNRIKQDIESIVYCDPFERLLRTRFSSGALCLQYMNKCRNRSLSKVEEHPVPIDEG